jgi:membrane protein YdbS with pleckstrin-like domain
VLFHGHPSWLSQLRLLVKGVLGALAVGIAAGLASAVSGGRVEVAWVLAGVLAVAAVVLALGHSRRRRLTYAVTNRRVRVEEGLIRRRQAEVRLHELSHVVVRQSLIGRLAGVGSLHFHLEDFSAGPTVLSFHGIERPRRVRQHVEREREWLFAAQGIRSESSAVEAPEERREVREMALMAARSGRKRL